MDPLLLLAAGGAALAFGLRKKKPPAINEIRCPPAPPPVNSPEWANILNQITGIASFVGSAGAAIVFPGMGAAIGGAITLGKQVSDFIVNAFVQGDMAAREAVRQRLIDTCYGHPPGSVWRVYGARKSLKGVQVTIADVYGQVGGQTLSEAMRHLWSRMGRTSQYTKPFTPTIPIESDVKYFVTMTPEEAAQAGVQPCCARRISPEEAVQRGHKLYTEKGAIEEWLRVADRRRIRELRLRLAMEDAMRQAERSSAGGSGFLEDYAIDTTRPPSRYEFTDIEYDHPVHGKIYLLCDPVRSQATYGSGKADCIWLRPGA